MLISFRIKFFVALVLLTPLFVMQAEPSTPPVQLDMFFSVGCNECEKVANEVLPEVDDLFFDQYELHSHDLGKAATIPLLLAYQERCDNHENGKVSIVVDRSLFLSGYDNIATKLIDSINKALIERQMPGWTLPAEPDISEKSTSERIKTRLRATTLSAVIVGGITDGFNPCAISTLIFFISILAVSKIDRRIRLLVGVSFITASFLVYMTIGFAFMKALRSLPNFEMVSKVFEIVIGLCMVPLAYLSFRDAWRFHKTERPSEVTLQIPDKIKKRMHSFMHNRLGVGGPILGGFITGAGVTILESVCTGQGYLPILTLMLKENTTNLTAWSLLALYNLLFVLPLTVVFICFHRGMEVTTLIALSKKNLVITKILLGLFFTTMTVLLLLL